MTPDQEKPRAAAKRYLHLAKQFRSHESTETTFRIFRGPRNFPATPGLRELRNALVMAGEWFIVAGGQAYCDSFVQTPSPPLSAYLIQHLPSTVELLYEEPIDLSLPEAFMLGGCANYCHWLVDFLPRLAFYRYAHHMPLLMNGPLQPFQVQALELLGIDTKDLIPLEYPRAYSVQKLLYPSTRSSVATPPLTLQPESLGWLRRAFKPHLVRSNGTRKIFVSRAAQTHSRSRRLLNEEELTAIAAKQGFEIVYCEQLSFKEQITLFSQASVIAGAHGAGFTNMVFAPSSAKVIELIGPRLARTPTGQCFAAMAKVLQQKFFRVVGRSDEQIPPYMNHLSFETYTIDAAEFQNAIRD